MKITCKGTRWQFSGKRMGNFRCRSAAKGLVETQVGFTATTPCCGDPACVRSISGGYPASFRPNHTEV